MPKLTQKTQPASPLLTVQQSVSTILRENGADLASKDITEQVMSLESLNPAQFSAISRKYDNAVALLKQAYADAQISTEGYTDAMWTAGAVAMLAAGDPKGYQAAAAQVPSGPGLISTEGHGMDYRFQPSMEAFDDRELTAALPFSVVFNVQAARQGDFAEAFYPTVVVTPDMAALDVSISRTMVFNEVRHDLTGKPTEFNRRNLVDAVIDSSILTNESTRAVPFYVAAGPSANTDKFSSLVTPYNRPVNGVNVLTAPLLPGIEIGLLGLSQSPAVQATGQLDNTDSLDHRIALERIFLRVENAAADVSVIPVDTFRLPRTQFQRAPEGLDRELILNFQTIDIPLTYETKDAAGAVASAAGGALAYLANPARQGWIVRLAIKITGSANLEIGTVSTNGMPITIDSVWNVDSNNVMTQVTDPATIAALKAELASISLDSLELEAYRSNLNRRTKGLQVTNLTQNERYVVPLLSPITCPTPVTNTRTATDMAAPITAARIQNDNRAVTKLINYADQLGALKISTDRKTPVPAVEGIGRHMVRPFYERKTVNVLERIASLTSQDRAGDVSAALVQVIREVVYRGYRDSGYQAALDALTGNTGERPTVLIGTDPVIQQHLMVSGDTRTLSIGFNADVVVSMDQRVYGKIFITLVRKGQTGPDPMSFGFMAWMPELATNLQITRNGATVQETMIQPRAVHINTLPWLVVLDIENLDVAVAGQVPVRTDEVLP